MDMKKVKQIIKVFEDSSLVEISLELSDIKIHMKKAEEHGYIAPIPPSVTDTNNRYKQKSNNIQGEAIKSPLVGTFYSAPSEDAKPFVRVGSNVTKGDTLCIIEAMKSMNEIKAEKNGVITHIEKENADMVQYDDVLMYIE